MRYGFTTGSCAAAAAKAAAYMLLTGKIKNCITIETPKGIPYTAEVTDIVRGESQVSCAVLVLTGGVIQYGLMKLFYKFPLSKAAFGAAAKREMNA